MEGLRECFRCHQQINANDFFCPFCGNKIRTPPPSTKFFGVVWLVVKTMLLPPLGFIWGYRYLKQENKKSKIIGVVVILITIIELVYGITSTVEIVDTANRQINQQFKLYGL